MKLKTGKKPAQPKGISYDAEAGMLIAFGSPAHQQFCGIRLAEKSDDDAVVYTSPRTKKRWTLVDNTAFGVYIAPEHRLDILRQKVGDFEVEPTMDPDAPPAWRPTMGDRSSAAQQYERLSAAMDALTDEEKQRVLDAL